MRRTLTTLFALGLAIAAEAYPVVSGDPNNVELNVWNTGLAQAKAKAQALNRPTLMVMLDSVNCSFSKSWISAIADSPEWQSFLTANSLVLVFADKPVMGDTAWWRYASPYAEVVDTTTLTIKLPALVLFRPDGSVADQFAGRGTLGKNPGFYNRVRGTTDPYSSTGIPPGVPPVTTAPGTIGFSQTSLTVSEGASSISATVTRQGGSSGRQTVEYDTESASAVAGVNFTGTGGTLVWNDGETAAQTVTVQLIKDRQWTVPAAKAFTLRLTRASGSASLGNAALIVTINKASPSGPSGDPSPIIAGSYQGFFYEPGQQTVRGTLTLSVSAKGALKAQAVLDGNANAFTGSLPKGTAGIAELQARNSSGSLRLQVDAYGILTGTLGDAALFGRRVDLSRAAEFTGYYTSILGAASDAQPEGAGYVTFTVSNRGAVKYAGVLADGTPFSGASTILAYQGAELSQLGYVAGAGGQNYAGFPIYTRIYAQRGVIAGQIWIAGGSSASPADNRVFLAGSEWVYPGGFAATLDDGDLTEVGAAFMKPANLAAAFSGTRFQTECGEVSVKPAGLSISLPSGNELKANLKASTTTGLFSGKFQYEPADGSSAYAVSYKGVLVPALGLGGGYYLTTDRAGGRQQQSRLIVIAP